MTLGELLVQPIEKQHHNLRDAYETIISNHAVLIPFDKAAARIHAWVRQDRAVSPPDAIQLSCAAAARIDLFVTKNGRLSRKTIPGIQFIASLERAFL